MKLDNEKLVLDTDERAIVVEDHGFMAGIFAIITYRAHRHRVYRQPTDSTVKRIRRLFKTSGDFARLRSSGPLGPQQTAPFPREYWMHPAPWKLEENGE